MNALWVESATASLKIGVNRHKQIRIFSLLDGQALAVQKKRKLGLFEGRLRNARVFGKGFGVHLTSDIGREVFFFGSSTDGTNFFHERLSEKGEALARGQVEWARDTRCRREGQDGDEEKEKDQIAN